MSDNSVIFTPYEIGVILSTIAIKIKQKPDGKTTITHVAEGGIYRGVEIRVFDTEKEAHDYLEKAKANGAFDLNTSTPIQIPSP